MRLVTWALLVGLAVASGVIGRLDVALALGGAKSALVGWEFMELRHAAGLHLAGYVLFVVALVGGLIAVA